MDSTENLLTKRFICTICNNQKNDWIIILNEHLIKFSTKIVYKLELQSLRKALPSRTRDFLSERYLKVKVDNKFSTLFPVISEVLQSFIINSHLFINFSTNTEPYKPYQQGQENDTTKLKYLLFFCNMGTVVYWNQRHLHSKKEIQLMYLVQQR